MALFDRVVGALVQATKPLFKDENRQPKPQRSGEGVGQGAPGASEPVAPTAPHSTAPDSAMPSALSAADLPDGKVTPWLPGFALETAGTATLRDLLPEAFIVIENRAALEDHAPFVAPYLTAHLQGIAPGSEWRYGTADAFVSVTWADATVTITRARPGREPSVYGPFDMPQTSTGEALVTLAADTLTVWQVDAGDVNAAQPLVSQGNEDGIDRAYEQDLADAAWLAAARVTVAGVDEIRVGYTGFVGLRDPQWVTHPDGTPVERDGRTYLTLTCAGPGHFPTAHWGVFSVDASSVTGLLSPRLEALHYFTRDGRVLGDHLGQLIMDDTAHHMVLSNRCNFGRHPQQLHISTVAADTDVLTGVHVQAPVKFAAPTLFDNWGPNLRRVDDRWLLTFVECLGYEPRWSFRPVLAAGTTGGGIGGPYTRVGTDPVHQQTEGVLLGTWGDELYVVASDGDAHDFPVYDLEMRRIAQVNAPFCSNIPHLLTVAVAGQPVRAVSFNGAAAHESVLGYGSHGDLVVLENRAP